MSAFGGKADIQRPRSPQAMGRPTTGVLVRIGGADIGANRPAEQSLRHEPLNCSRALREYEAEDLPTCERSLRGMTSGAALLPTEL